MNDWEFLKHKKRQFQVVSYELREMTGNSESNLIGNESFGLAYKGYLREGLEGLIYHKDCIMFSYDVNFVRSIIVKL